MDESVTRAEFEKLQQKVQKNLELTEDTNRVLHRMRTVGRYAFVAKIIVWGVVLIVPLLLYPYIAPFVPSLLPTATSTSLTSNSLFGLPSPSEIQQLFHAGK
jgi:hypothetical protein